MIKDETMMQVSSITKMNKQKKKSSMKLCEVQNLVLNGYGQKENF
jgi:hypothetical protein